MRNIEFIGPPGSGKTTLISELLRRTDDLQQPSGTQYFLNNASRKFTTPYKLAPAVLTTHIKQLIESHYLRNNLYKFIDENPVFIHTCSTLAAKTSRPAYFLKWLLKGAERRQIANEIPSDDLRPVLDENLCHYGAHMMTESPGDTTFSDVEGFFNSFASPDILVHVTTPSDVGIERQRQRGEVHSFVNHVPDTCESPMDAYDRFNQMCRLVTENLRSDIIRVENTGPVEKEARALSEELESV